MNVNNLLTADIRVVNIGLEQFCEDLQEQQVECLQMQWSIPIYVDDEIMALLDYFRDEE